mgnify:CR=1 FL=1
MGLLLPPPPPPRRKESSQTDEINMGVKPKDPPLPPSYFRSIYVSGSMATDSKSGAIHIEVEDMGLKPGSKPVPGPTRIPPGLGKPPSGGSSVTKTIYWNEAKKQESSIVQTGPLDSSNIDPLTGRTKDPLFWGEEPKPSRLEVQNKHIKAMRDAMFLGLVNQQKSQSELCCECEMDTVWMYWHQENKNPLNPVSYCCMCDMFYLRLADGNVWKEVKD